MRRSSVRARTTVSCCAGPGVCLAQFRFSQVSARAHRGPIGHGRPDMRRIAPVVVSSLICLLPVGSVGARQTAAQKPVKASRAPDVIYVPTPPGVVKAMLDTAKVTSKDLLYRPRLRRWAHRHRGGQDLRRTRSRGRHRSSTHQRGAGQCRRGRRHRPRQVHRERPLRDQSAAGDRRHAVLARVAQHEAPAQARDRVEARHAHRFTRVQHGSMDTRPVVERGRPPSVPLDDSAQVRRGRRRPSTLSEGGRQARVR